MLLVAVDVLLSAAGVMVPFGTSTVVTVIVLPPSTLILVVVWADSFLVLLSVSVLDVSEDVEVLDRLESALA